MMAKTLYRLFFCLILALPLLEVAPYHTGQGGAASQDAAVRRILVKLKSNPGKAPEDGVVALSAERLSLLNTLSAKYHAYRHECLCAGVSASPGSNPLRHVLVIELPEGADANSLLAEYRNLEFVEYAHLDWRAELYEVPNDPLYGVQWPLNNVGQFYPHVMRFEGSYNDQQGEEQGSPDADIDAREVFDNLPDRTGVVVVAVIDTGVDRDHPDLSGRMWVNQRELPGNGKDDDHNGYIDDFYGWDFCGDTLVFPHIPDSDPSDQHGHGTHCAGIIAAQSGNGLGIAGIIDSCQIMSLKFFPAMLASYTAQAIVYAADNGADVISMSFGYRYPVKIVEDALGYARDKGVILVAAAGNDGMEYDNYPAAYKSVIAVGATDSRDHVTKFSTFGDHLEICAPGLSILSLRAQGTDMYGLDEEPFVHIFEDIYYLASGTSMAGPHVAGAAAYLRSISPGLQPESVREILLESADDLVDPFGEGQQLSGWDEFSGYGRLNVHRAVSKAPALHVQVMSPLADEIVSGDVLISGRVVGEDLISYRLDLGVGANPSSWSRLASGIVPVESGALANWNTIGLDGTYTLRLSANESHADYVTLFVANAEVAEIIAPAAWDSVRSYVVIEGTASAPDFSHYSVSFESDTRPDVQGVIAVSARPVTADHLAIWSAAALETGWYSLQLSIFSGSGLAAADTISVFVQSLFSGESGWRVRLPGRVSIAPNYGDVDGDGANEIYVGTDSGLAIIAPDGSPRAYRGQNHKSNAAIGAIDESNALFKGHGGSANTALGFEGALAASDMRVPAAIGDLDGDGRDDLVVLTTNFLVGIQRGEVRFAAKLAEPVNTRRYQSSDDAFYPLLFLKDHDGDGRDEIHLYPGGPYHEPWEPRKPHGNYIYDADGSVMLSLTNYSRGRLLPADLDGDGRDEIYMSTTKVCEVSPEGEAVRCFDLQNPVTEDFLTKELTAVDLDKDGKLELVVYGFVNLEFGHYWMYAFDEELSLKPSWPRNTGISSLLTTSSPVFVDIDLDGALEYFITFYEWAYGQIYAWRPDGSPYAGDSLSALFGATDKPAMLHSPIFADVNADSYPELIACAVPDVLYTCQLQRICAWDRYGQQLPGWPLIIKAGDPTTGDSYVGSRFAPVVGDIDQDGYLDLMMTMVESDLLFINFDDVPFDPTTSPVSCWRYNRRLNNTVPVAGTGGPTDADDAISLTLPREFTISQNYPNPFNFATTIEYSLPVTSDVRVTIFNVLGQTVGSRDLGSQAGGLHRFVWDSRNANGGKVSSGFYFYRIEANGVALTRKMILLK